MHLYWGGIAADLWRAGDKSLEWMLREARSSPPVTRSAAMTCRAYCRRPRLNVSTADYKFTGHKMFGSLAPVWTMVCTAWSRAECGPKIVHGFMLGYTKGYRIADRFPGHPRNAPRGATTGFSTALFVPDHYVGRILPAGTLDQFIVALFGLALMGIEHLLRPRPAGADVAIANVKNKDLHRADSQSWPTTPRQHAIAQMQLSFASIAPHLEHVARDWSDGVDHGALWPSMFCSAKTTPSRRNVVDIAMDVSGGGGMFKTSELERLYRDAACGRFHPANAMLTDEIVENRARHRSREQPRWG